MSEPRQATIPKVPTEARGAPATVAVPTTLRGVLLWPSLELPPQGNAAPVLQTGVVEHHWQHTPGVLNMARQDPNWSTAEAFVAKDYAYLRDAKGTPLPDVDVDLYRDDVEGVDFDDYGDFDSFYKQNWNRVEHVKTLEVKLLRVDCIKDADLVGPGDWTFVVSGEGQSVGPSDMFHPHRGDTGVEVPWSDPSGGVLELDVSSNLGDVELRFAGTDRDPLRNQALGEGVAVLQWPWPTERVERSVATDFFVAHYEIVPVLSTLEDRASAGDDASPDEQRDGLWIRHPMEAELYDARVATTRTDADGAFQFTGVPPGDYIITLRARFAFVENRYAGADPVPAPAGDARHNGVLVRELAERAATPRLHVKVHLQEDGGEPIFNVPEGQGFRTFDVPLDSAVSDDTPRPPYRLYVLPLLSKSNTDRWRDCKRELARAFAVSEQQAEAVMDQRPFLDLEALNLWDLQDADYGEWVNTPEVIEADDVDPLLKRTLLIRGDEGEELRSMAYDHVQWVFAKAHDRQKSRGRFVPLGDEEIFRGPAPLYTLSPRTRVDYGRCALRWIGPAPAAKLDGFDVGEVKLRLGLWGSENRPVTFVGNAGRDDSFDESLREAVIRFKWHEGLLRERVEVGGNLDAAQCVVVAIVDAQTYQRMDAMDPPALLGRMASTERGPANNQFNPNGDPILTEYGYGRTVFYAMENARQRLMRARGLANYDYNMNSGFRSLAHNRYVYVRYKRPVTATDDGAQVTFTTAQDHALTNGNQVSVWQANNNNWAYAGQGAVVVVNDTSFRVNGINSLGAGPQPPSNGTARRISCLKWRLASNANMGPQPRLGFLTQVGGVAGANGTNHGAGDVATLADVLYNEPRGTYTNVSGANGDRTGEAADYSNHTTGRAMDFFFRDPNAANVNLDTETLRDRHAMERFGAQLGGNDPRFWLETVGLGASNWIHMDSGKLRWGAGANMQFREEYALTQEDMRGARWDSNVVVTGTVTQNGAPRLGAQVQLSVGNDVLKTTYADRNGVYELRLDAADVALGFTVTARYPSRQQDAHHPSPYPFQPRPAGAAPASRSVSTGVGFAWAGEHATNVDLVIPPPPP